MNDVVKQSLQIEKELSTRLESLYQKAVNYIENARTVIKKSIDAEMPKTYWLIGQDIVQEEQQGSERAEYGRAILKSLSLRLQQQYQRGFSVDTLEKARKFYLFFPKGCSEQKSATLSRKLSEGYWLPNLSWSHYVEIIGVKRQEASNFTY